MVSASLEQPPDLPRGLRGLVLLTAALTTAGGLAMLAVSCAKNPQAPDPALASPFIQVDVPEDWSHDGRLIAFRRRFASNYGPPGIYLIQPSGGTPRWLCPASFYWPSQLRFSPDDRSLLGIVTSNLVIIDVASGNIRQPITTNSGVFSATWLPDGERILYYRVSYDVPDAPPDSSWLHVLDLTTSSDVPIRPDSQLVDLMSMRTGPTGDVLAREIFSYSDRLVLYNPETNHITPLFDPGIDAVITNPQWLWRPSRGIGAAIFEMRIHGYVGWTVDLAGGEPRRFAQSWNSFTLMAPTGEQFVLDGNDPNSRNGILDVIQVDDLAGASRRHLTRFTPAQAASPD